MQTHQHSAVGQSQQHPEVTTQMGRRDQATLSGRSHSRDPTAQTPAPAAPWLTLVARWTTACNIFGQRATGCRYQYI